MCECAFAPYADGEEESYHYLRTCLHCGKQWYSLHCEHDGYQNPCPQCGERSCEAAIKDSPSIADK